MDPYRFLKNNYIFRSFLILLITGCITCAGYFLFASQNHNSIHNPIGLSPDFTSSRYIAGQGEIIPESDIISLFPRRSDVVETIYVKEGQHLKKNDPVYKLCTDELMRQRAVYLTEIAIARAQLKYLEEQPRTTDVNPYESEVKCHSEEVIRLKKKMKRAVKLIGSQAVSHAEYDDAEGLLKIAEANLAHAEDNLKQVLAGPSIYLKNEAKAKIDKAQAELAVIDNQIKNSTVRAPIDGIILKINVHPGEYISLTSFSLSEEKYANPPVTFSSEKLQLRAEFDELFASRIHNDVSGYAVIHTDTKRKIPLHFSRIIPQIMPKKSLSGNPDEVINSKILQIVFDFDTPDFPIFIGQRMNVLLDCKSQKHH